MEYVLGLIVLIVLLAIVVFIPCFIIQSLACKDCPLKEKCEKEVRDNGITLCHNNNHLHMNYFNHFNPMI